MLVFWSAKGGVGCTTVALGVAMGAASAGEVLLVDLAGDAPHVLGCPPPTLGVTDWLDSDAPSHALTRLEVEPGHSSLSLLPFGGGRVTDTPRVDELATTLRSDTRQVIVDAGQITTDASASSVARRRLIEQLGSDILVTRPCYLALRRAAALQAEPAQVVVVAEAGRSLTAGDVERTLGAPVVALVDVDPAVARAVDAGLIGTRLPRVFSRQIRGMA